MSIVSLIVLLVVLGVALWFINTCVPMAAPFKTLINIIVVLAVVIWLLSAFGFLGLGVLPTLHTGKFC
jgi:hypothetical protein